MKFTDIFNPIEKGSHGFTDEAIYSSIRNSDIIIPLYGGNNQHNYTERYVSSKTFTVDGKIGKTFSGEGIIISLDGSSGSMTYKSGELFALNHHAGFITLKECGREIVNLRYFALFMQNHYKSMCVSDGSKTLSLAQIYSDEFDLPEKAVQDRIMNSMSNVINKLEKLNGIYKQILGLINKSITINYRIYQAKNVSAESLLNYMSGNSGLTEEFLYNNIGLAGKKYKILSSATIEENMLGEIPMCKINNRNLKVFSTTKEALLVIRKGKAGITNYLSAGDYTLNDDAYILYKKIESPYEVSMKWLAIQYMKEFLEYASSADNGTWNMTGFFRNVSFDIPDYNEQVNLVKLYERADDVKKKIEEIQTKFSVLLSKEIN